MADANNWNPFPAANPPVEVAANAGASSAQISLSNFAPADPCEWSTRQARAVRAHKMDEWLGPVEEKLKALFPGEKFVKLKRKLQGSGAIIAGGSILSFVTKYIGWSPKESDLDIYVPISNAKNFIESFVQSPDVTAPKLYNATRYKIHGASLYCSSFLRRNKIKQVYRFMSENSQPKFIDIMSVRKSRTPQQVASNFDLSFCQIWYDGCNVYATNPSHIRGMIGALQGDYVKTYIEGNKFLRDRMQKYTKRGFKILLDPTITRLNIALTFTDTCDRKLREPDMYKRWAKKGILNYLLHQDDDDVKESPFLLKGKLYTGRERFQAANVPTPTGRNELVTPWAYDKISEFHINKEDGYDSEDYELEPLAKELYAPDAAKELNPLTGEAAAARLKTEVYIKSMIDTDILYNFDKHREIRNLAWLKNMAEAEVERIANAEGLDIQGWEERLEEEKAKLAETEKFIAALNAETTLEGEDALYDEGRLFHLHRHPINGGITRDSLMGYLEGHIQDVDKNTVPCFYQPNQVAESPENCKETLTLKEVFAIVFSDGDKEENMKWWKKYAKEADLKGGLDQTVTSYDAILSNSKKTDPIGFGDIFERSICPFCLQYESRDQGCAYLTHANPRKLEDHHAPFCSKEFVVPEIIEKYKDAALEFEDDEELIHLEFCVECGRPSQGHKHFDFADHPAYVENFKKAGHDDYGSCPGGGRRELIARALAIRDVYAEPGAKDSKEERKRAALAADAAAAVASAADAARAAVLAAARDAAGSSASASDIDAAITAAMPAANAAANAAAASAKARIQAIFSKKDDEDDAAYAARTDYLARAQAIIDKVKAAEAVTTKNSEDIILTFLKSDGEDDETYATRLETDLPKKADEDYDTYAARIKAMRLKDEGETDEKHEGRFEVILKKEDSEDDAAYTARTDTLAKAAAAYVRAVATRKWNNEIPKEKEYTNYVEGENNSSNYNGSYINSNEEIEPAEEEEPEQNQEGGKRRVTRRKKRVAKRKVANSMHRKRKDLMRKEIKILKKA